MKTQLINPNNPLRRQTPVAAQGQKSQPRVQKTASSNDGTRSEMKPIPTPVLQQFSRLSDEQNFESNGTFNPMRYAGLTGDGALRRVASAQTDRMYDARGEINAYDKRDALAQAAHLLNNVTRQSPLGRVAKQASASEKEETRKILAAALSDPTGEGFALVGQELALPIKAIVDYEGWIRKILRTRTLAQGELFRIAKDVRATAYSVGQDGQSIASRAYGSYIQPDEGKITSFPEVDLMEIYQMNYDVLDRMQDTARQEIEVEEDKRGLLLLDRMSQAVNTVSTFSTMSISVFENLRYQVERHRLVVDKFLLNRQELSDVQINMSANLDPVTQRELNLAGYFGRFLGAHILTCAGTGVEEVVPAGTLYACTSPEYLGEMGTRVELFSEPYNGFANKQTIKGWAFVEVVGFGGPNSRSIAKAVKA